MQGYMYPIALTTQKYIRSTFFDLLNTHMACGAITLHPINYPSFIKHLKTILSHEL